jgi:hypothetical protein
VAAAEQPLASFRAVSLAWSERRSATLPLQEFAPSQPRWTRRLAWGATAAAALAFGIVVPGLHRPAASGTVAVAQVAAPTQVTPVAQLSRQEQIARDNQMLREIDRELDASVETPVALGLAAESGNRGHNRGSLRD